MALLSKTTNDSTTRELKMNSVVSKIAIGMKNTLILGLVVGFGGIIGYSLNLQENMLQLLFLFCLLGAATFMGGYFLGFLFGIPKRNAANNSSTESDYNLNNNLVDISDWLTKIIIGVGLIEIKSIPDYLGATGDYIMEATGGPGSITIFSTCTIIYFTIFGLYYGYNYMRLTLSGQFKEADENLLKRKEEYKEKSNQLYETVRNKIPANKLENGRKNIDESTKQVMENFDELLQSLKTEDQYTFEDWYLKGIAEYNNGQYDKTKMYMEKALSKDKKHESAADAYLYLGLAYDALNMEENAIQQYNTILQQYPKYRFTYLVHYNMGCIYDELYEYGKALDSYNKALSMNPYDAASYNNKAAALISLITSNKNPERNGQYAADALEASEKAISIKSDYAQPWYNKARIYALDKDKANMLQSLTTAVKLNSGFKVSAKMDKEFSEYLNDADFQKLIT